MRECICAEGGWDGDACLTACHGLWWLYHRATAADARGPQRVRHRCVLFTGRQHHCLGVTGQDGAVVERVQRYGRVCACVMGEGVMCGTGGGEMDQGEREAAGEGHS